MSGSEWGPDVTHLWEKVYRLIHFSDTMSILDIGCGTGYDISRFGECCGVNAQFIGVDTSHRSIRKAEEKYGSDTRFRFIQGDISAG